MGWSRAYPDVINPNPFDTVIQVVHCTTANGRGSKRGVVCAGGGAGRAEFSLTSFQGQEGAPFLIRPKARYMRAVAWDEQKWLEPGRDTVFLGILTDFFSCTCRKEM